jgi:integrase
LTTQPQLGTLHSANPGAAMENNMARRRYQRGSVFLRGKRDLVWVGRWREDVINQAGQVERVHRKEVLGSKRDFPTKKLALRELESRLSPINSTGYRALRTPTFSQFAKEWQANVLSTKKQSTQATIVSQLAVSLLPFFGHNAMKDITARAIQSFLHSQSHKAPKTVRNYVTTLRMMWHQAKAWNYVNHNPFEGVVLPRPTRVKRRFFSEEEVKLIINAAPEPQRTLFWMAAETGLRAGELFGLHVADVDLSKPAVRVSHSVWDRTLQTPKTAHSYREFAISPDLSEHLRKFHANTNPSGLLFSTKRDRPHDRASFVRRYLWPLLDSLGIQRCGLHAFRHTNGSLMDRLGTPMKLRQQRLGHAPGSDITMAVYTHIIGDDDHTVAAQLGAILRPMRGYAA